MTATETEGTEAVPTDGVPVTIDGTDIVANKSELLIDAAERHGVYIPRFCYHSRMKPVGMCRMCLVEVDTGRGPGLQPSCMLPVSDGMVVDTESDRTKKAQDGVLEFLLINHPLDCPVCDKGGECPLQDQTVAYGPGESRFVEEKRHFEKPIPISDTVYLDRERCILCDRCTRFASEVAGDPLIHFQSRGNQTEVNTFPDEPFSSYFSGNTVQICPVGALTAKPYRFKARPWDLAETASTSVIDSVGARITVQSSRNEVLRYLGIDSDPVNWGWLSDKERFSFETWNSPNRVTTPLVRGDDLGAHVADGEHLVESSWSSALGQVADALKSADPSRVAFLGGARMSTESQYAWSKLAKSIVGTDNVDAQMGSGPSARTIQSLNRATIDEVCAAGGTILLVGADPKETHGSLFLRLRHAVVHDGATLVEVNPRSSGLTEFAAASKLVAPGTLFDEVESLANDSTIAEILDGATNLSVVFGEGSLAEDPAIIDNAVRRLAELFPAAKFLPVLPRGNVMGALDVGLAPGLLPGRTELGTTPTSWNASPTDIGLDAHGVINAAAAGKIDVLVLLGADPLTDFPAAIAAEEALHQVGTIVSIETHLNYTSTGADVVLPAAATAIESDGTFTNAEGRISPIRRQVTAPGTARPDWMIAAEIAALLGSDLGFIDLDELWDDLAATSAHYAGLSWESISSLGDDGQVLGTAPLAAIAPERPNDTPAGGIGLVLTREMYDAGTLLSQAPSMSGLARGARAAMLSSRMKALGIEDGDHVSLRAGSVSVTLPALADPGVPDGAVAVAVNQPDAQTSRLVSGAASTSIEVEVPA